MVANWTAALDALLATGEFHDDAVGYAGLSGGTLFGLPYIASDTRIVAAALGACGLEGAPLLEDAPSIFAPILRAAARQYRRPTHFLLQTEDDYFLPGGGRALFATLSSPDKQLLASPGTHTQVPTSAVDTIDQLVGGAATRCVVNEIGRSWRTSGGVEERGLTEAT